MVNVVLKDGKGVIIKATRITCDEGCCNVWLDNELVAVFSTENVIGCWLDKSGDDVTRYSDAELRTK